MNSVRSFRLEIYEHIFSHLNLKSRGHHTSHLCMEPNEQWDIVGPSGMELEHGRGSLECLDHF
jgi:hypothetical protein